MSFNLRSQDRIRDVVLVVILIALGVLVRSTLSASYLIDMDSFYYARKIAEYLQNGLPNSLFMLRTSDPLMSLPTDGSDPLVLNGLSVLGAVVGKLFGLSANTVNMRLGTFVSSLLAIPAFIFVKRRTNSLGGFAAGGLLAVALPFVIHTCTGVYDTDMVLGVLPMCFFAFGIEGILSDSRKGAIVNSIFAASSCALISCFWTMYYAYFYLFVICALFLAIRMRKWLSLALTTVLSILFTLPIHGLETFSDLSSIFKALFSLSSTTSVESKGVFAYVSEMRGLPPLETVSYLGGFFVLAFAVFSIVYLIIKKERSLWVIIPWLVVGVALGIKSGRFLEIAVIPLSVLCGLGIGKLKDWNVVVASIIAVALLVYPVFNAVDTLKNIEQPVSEDLVLGTEYLVSHSPDDAVVVSWWDLGYFYQYMGIRSIVDGGIPEVAKYEVIADMLAQKDTHLIKTYISKLVKEDVPVYLVITDDMLDKTQAMSYYGNTKINYDSIIYTLFYGDEDVENLEYIFSNDSVSIWRILLK